MTECNETFECFAEEPKVYESEEEHFNDIFAGYEADHQKALALIDWQKEQIKSLETAIKVYRSCLEHNNLDPKLYDAGCRKQSGWISVEERLPEENVYVLIFEGLSIQVARIIKGISEEEREKMKNGELPDPVSFGYTLNEVITLRRSMEYRSCDVWGNNLVPYCWKANGGPMEWFGQNVTHWMPLPEAPKGGAE